VPRKKVRNTMARALLILPNSLIEHHKDIDRSTHIFCYEHPRYITDFHYHAQKLIFHRATLKAYAEKLIDVGFRVHYIEYTQDLAESLKKQGVAELIHYAPGDTAVEKNIALIAKRAGCKAVRHENPIFLTPEKVLYAELSDKSHYSMASFYRAQRKRLRILVTSGGKPVGEKWSFDGDNRKPLPRGIKIPELPTIRISETYREAIAWQQKHFPRAYGESTQPICPITHDSARGWLDAFFEERFIHFGDYQDAIVPGSNTLFHSVISPLINVGLLTPIYVIERALEFTRDHKSIRINNLEGFIRQIIGWREFVYGVYLVAGDQQRKSNFFEHTHVLPESWWNGSTGIEPVDDAIARVLNDGYTHHIERLMVLGNFMLLSEYSPDAVYEWFMSLFIDAYDWVMVPNVYGMSQYADGGLMTTKPYISGSAYIKRMSSYKNGPWAAVWDALYWHFIARHEKIIQKNPRLAIMSSYLRRMNPEKRDRALLLAKRYLASRDD
jgi:deoxyribodipyrimidine photolyase-related protein